MQCGCRRQVPTRRLRSSAVTAAWSASNSSTPLQLAGSSGDGGANRAAEPLAPLLVHHHGPGECFSSGASCAACAPSTTMRALPATSAARVIAVCSSGRPRHAHQLLGRAEARRGARREHHGVKPLAAPRGSFPAHARPAAGSSRLIPTGSAAAHARERLTLLAGWTRRRYRRAHAIRRVESPPRERLERIAPRAPARRRRSRANSRQPALPCADATPPRAACAPRGCGHARPSACTSRAGRCPPPAGAARA